MSRYICCETGEKPAKPGFYVVDIVGVRSMFDNYLEFDGQEWVGLKELQAENEGGAVRWIEGAVPRATRPATPNVFRKSPAADEDWRDRYSYYKAGTDALCGVCGSNVAIGIEPRFNCTRCEGCRDVPPVHS